MTALTRFRRLCWYSAFLQAATGFIRRLGLWVTPHDFLECRNSTLIVAILGVLACLSRCRRGWAGV